MNNLQDQFKACQMKWLIPYLANTISIFHKYFGNKPNFSYDTIYNCCIHAFNYTEEELDTIYKAVDDVLNEEYSLLIANKDKLVLVDLTERNQDE